MDFYKVGFVIIVKGSARGAVRFITNNQVKISQVVQLLGFADDINGVVGGKNHADMVAVMAFADFLGKLLGVGGGGIAQFMGEGLHDVIVFFALLAHVVIRTNRKTVQGRGGFLRPFSQGLRQQR